MGRGEVGSRLEDLDQMRRDRGKVAFFVCRTKDLRDRRLKKVQQASQTLTLKRRAEGETFRSSFLFLEAALSSACSHSLSPMQLLSRLYRFSS